MSDQRTDELLSDERAATIKGVESVTEGLIEMMFNTAVIVARVTFEDRISALEDDVSELRDAIQPPAPQSLRAS